MHIPVLLKEVVEILEPREGDFVVDLTVGAGGHAFEFANKIGKKGILVGVDTDEEMLKIAEKKLMSIEESRRPQIFLVHSNFSYIDQIIEKLNSEEGLSRTPDIFFADLGVSSYHFDWAERGFSLNKLGPLDMRLSRSGLTAEYVIMNFPEKQIEEILRKYGEERLSRRIAKEIVKVRQKKKISTTLELAEIVQKVYRSCGIFPKIHPATKTFMALRIFVNKELENLEALLEKIPSFVKNGTKIGIISFHSLEDRIVKKKFSSWQDQFLGKIITKKPITPSEEEIILNPRSRSAKFRAFCFER